MEDDSRPPYKRSVQKERGESDEASNTVIISCDLDKHIVLYCYTVNIYWNLELLESGLASSIGYTYYIQSTIY